MYLGVRVGAGRDLDVWAYADAGGGVAVADYQRACGRVIKGMDVRMRGLRFTCGGRGLERGCLWVAGICGGVDVELMLARAWLYRFGYGRKSGDGEIGVGVRMSSGVGVSPHLVGVSPGVDVGVEITLEESDVQEDDIDEHQKPEVGHHSMAPVWHRTQQASQTGHQQRPRNCSRDQLGVTLKYAYRNSLSRRYHRAKRQFVLTGSGPVQQSPPVFFYPLWRRISAPGN
ncbi:unnamed protein product [Toxocara canis]|uniref:Uncharacterized protein n=1 Tax=Toxocara canis TaxID=6265 RepID=A0A183UG30_TOXCA|nr:unnamed protein product [Toxocara canis]